jgi:hypothetical protein
MQPGDGHSNAAPQTIAMKIYIESVGGNELSALLRKLHGVADRPLHVIADDPSVADLILLCGSWSKSDSVLTGHPLVKLYPEKCAVYSDMDGYLPLLPGVYCSPMRGYSTRIGRVRSYSYIVRHIQKGNPFIQPLAGGRTRDLLFSFQGSISSWVRKRLFKMDFGRPDILIEDTTHHQNWVQSSSSERQQKLYVETIGRSHFVLCPRGSGSGSFRFFETMRMGVAPVLIADGYVLPEGPDWDSFLIRVAEKEIENLPAILEPRRGESEDLGERAREAWERWFSTSQEFNQIVAQCELSLRSSGSSERIYRRLWPVMTFTYYSRRTIRKRIRASGLWLLRTLRLKPPYKIRDQAIPDFDPKSAKDDISLEKVQP